jgi:hypothetical protein
MLIGNPLCRNARGANHRAGFTGADEVALKTPPWQVVEAQYFIDRCQEA